MSIGDPEGRLFHIASFVARGTVNKFRWHSLRQEFGAESNSQTWNLPSAARRQARPAMLDLPDPEQPKIPCTSLLETARTAPICVTEASPLSNRHPDKSGSFVKGCVYTCADATTRKETLNVPRQTQTV